MRERALQIFLFIVVVASVPAALNAQQQRDLSSLDQSLQSVISEWKIPGATVSIVQSDSVVYMKGFGVRDINTRQPVTPDTLFDIGSCTKAFTAAAIAELVDDGKMQWDGRVDNYLPAFHLSDPEADEHVTIRDLLTHRTGLPGADLVWYGSSMGRDELIRRVAYIPSRQGFRSRFEYQNLMFLAAGQAAGQAAGTTWDDLVHTRIFGPLGMSRSVTTVAEAQKSGDVATPHEQNHDGSIKTIAWFNLDNVAPAGAISSSARDMAKWIELQLDDGMYQGKRVISEKNMQEMHEPQMVVPRNGEIGTVFFPDSMQLSYGLGWFVQDYRGHELILHPGDIDGFAAETVLIPEIHSGFFLAINRTSLGRQVMVYDIVDKLLNLSDAGWSAHFHKLEADSKAEEEKSMQSWESKRIPGTHPSHDLPAYAGDFENPAYGDANIAFESGKLVLHFHSIASDLDHFQYDTFVTGSTADRKSRVTFFVNGQGQVDKLVFDNITFTRSAPATKHQTATSQQSQDAHTVSAR
ncbi:MAG TPA: serine hydrolase [Terriglobales bacterium]|nr:serine hydrolase [Terriglobales bacterium]